MKTRSASNQFNVRSFFSIFLPFLLFWSILSLRIPETVGQYFHTFSLPTVLIIFILYYLAFQLRDRAGLLVSLGLTMALTALSLSYIWSSGFSDNFLISGLVPYKDAKNYFLGSQFLLHGFPLVGADQGTERPLFPSFLASILFITGQNLKITLAIITQLTAAAMYMSARQVRDSFGAPAASLFATLLYLYQPFIGYTMSETLGFLAGCLAFTMIWLAARSMKWQYLVPGVLVLLVAISARAGAFFIFPMLALWMGWIFRGEKRFSIQMAAFALIGMAIGYFLLNSLYARTVGIPPGSSFGNFSYALYGQVRGGTGWHSAIEDLGTRNPSIVYREAWQFFLKHPLSLAIGFAKAYRDFFGFGGSSMFPFGAFSSSIWIKISLWLVSMSLLVVGLVRALKDVHNHFSALILAGFAGILLSIPFLPPIDGGSRFYAGSAPFFFILPAVGLSWLWGNRQQPQLSVDTWHGDILPAGYFSIAVLVVTLIVPPLLYSLSPRPTFDLPSCPAGQEPFFIEYHPGSYVDLVKSEAQACGFVPAVCQDDFERNNIEKSIDDFYQTVFTLMEYDSSDVRLIPALNFANNKFHYFYLSSQELNGMPSGAISGCAVEVPTRNQTIYQVKSWSLQK